MEKIRSFASVQVKVLAEEAIQTLSSFSKMGFSTQTFKGIPPSLAQMCFHQCKVYKLLQFWNDILKILHEFFESNICLTPKVLGGSLNRKGFSLLFSFCVPWFSLKSQYPYIVGADMVEKV
jgi:hypothetical protein